VVGKGPIQVRFFEDERAGDRSGGGEICLTDDLRQLAGSVQGGGFADNVVARWQLGRPPGSSTAPGGGVAVPADAAQDLLFVEQDRHIRWTSLPRVRGALNGYQHGRCRAEMPVAATEVDHFFPWMLKQRGLRMPVTAAPPVPAEASA
jgi:hypothetical protein